MKDQIQKFADRVQTMRRDYYNKQYPKIMMMDPAAADVLVKFGQKYAKLIVKGSVFCFVDMASGNVLKAAGWKAPAKGVRGNINDASDGMNAVNVYGANYITGRG